MPGFIQDKLEIKFLILYIAARIEEAVPFDTMLDLTLCDACEDKPCVSRCYFGALCLQDGRLRHDDDACSGCGLCRHICPKGAVKINAVS